MTFGGSIRLACIDRSYLYFGIIDPCLGPTNLVFSTVSAPGCCLHGIVHITPWTFFSFPWLDPRVQAPSFSNLR